MIPRLFGDKKMQNQVPTDDLWTVFLVEDDLDDQKLAARILKDSPFLGEIICVSNSESLFDRLAKHKYLTDDEDKKVLVLLDIHMPGLNGLTLLEQLKSNPYTSNFPIVMITGDQKPEKVYESYLRNANCFISKPITHKHLTDIHTLLEYGPDRNRAINVF
jgi:two-component system, chemotaxis family, response regulator Rcp1